MRCNAAEIAVEGLWESVHKQQSLADAKLLVKDRVDGHNISTTTTKL